jgi:histidine triad (HIT) family protein
VSNASDCIFCKIVAGDIPATFVHQDDQAVAFADIHPQAPTHLLVVPRRHIGSLEDTTAADVPLLGHLLALARSLAHERGLHAKGYRVGTNVGRGAGQSVFHLHLHVLGGRSLSPEMG